MHNHSFQTALYPKYSHPTTFDSLEHDRAYSTQLTYSLYHHNEDLTAIIPLHFRPLDVRLCVNHSSLSHILNPPPPRADSQPLCNLFTALLYSIRPLELTITHSAPHYISRAGSLAGPEEPWAGRACACARACVSEWFRGSSVGRPRRGYSGPVARSDNRRIIIQSQTSTEAAWMAESSGTG